MAALATNPGSPLDYVGLHKVKIRPLPTIAIPTTAGTGSEVSLWSVFTDDSRQLKVAMGGPPALSDDRGVRSGAHGRTSARADRVHRDGCARARDRVLHEQGVPADLRRRSRSSDRADRSAPAGRRAARHGDRRVAVRRCCWRSTMAGMAMNSTRLGLAHALAMPLGSWDLKIPHSIAIAVTLPHGDGVQLLGGAGAVRRGRAGARRMRRTDAPRRTPLPRARRPSRGSPATSASRRDCRRSGSASTTWTPSSRKR